MDELESWRAEQESAYLYRVLAEVEPEGKKRVLFQQLARAAERQAASWAEELGGRSGGHPAAYAATARVRMIGRLVRVLGVRRMLPVLAAAKVRGLSTYRAPAARRATSAPHPMPEAVGEDEQRHRSTRSGGSLRAAVFGVNDGLVSNTCLLLGLAGAETAPELYVLAGSAGLLAGALSMAAGEYLSVRAQREFAEHQIGIERAELARYPEEEAEELALIYEARGLELAQARELAQSLVRDPESALDTLAREELGLDPTQLGAPLGAALASLASFAAGAAIPLLPFLLGLARPIPAAIGSAALALFGVGCGLALFTGRGLLWSGVRMLLVGGSAGLLTWWIGSLVGAALG